MSLNVTSVSTWWKSLIALCLLAASPPAMAEDPPDYLLEQDHEVVLGAEELAYLMSGSWWNSEFTFYNATALKIGNRYALWAQVGWDAAGCEHFSDGLDQVVVFTSTSPGPAETCSPCPTSPFQPRWCNDACAPGTVDMAEMRASLVTGCDPGSGPPSPLMWGLGEVIPYNAADDYLATFDLGRDDALALGDYAKYEFTLASSDGLDRTSDMYTFAKIDPQSFAEPIPRMVEPVAFKIDSDTVGILFHFFSRETEVPNLEDSVFCCGGTGFMYIDFDTFPGDFTVRVLDENGVYRTLDPADHVIDFKFKSIGSGGRGINRVQRVDGQWVAFFSDFQNPRPGTCPTGDRGSNIAYQPFFLNGSQWGGWLDPIKGLQTLSADVSESLVWDNLTGLQAPSPLVVPGGERHFYYTRDTECTGGFGQLDVVYAEMEARNANLLNAAGFELGVLETPLAKVKRGSLLPVASPVHEGIYSLRHAATGNDSLTYPWRGSISPLMALQGEETIHFSAWAKADQNASIQLFLFCLDDLYDHRSYPWASASFTATTSWQLFEHSHTCPEGASYVSARLDNNNAGKTVWWDDTRIVDSNLLQDGEFDSGELLLPFHKIKRGELSVPTISGHTGELTEVLEHYSTGNDSFTHNYWGSRDAAVTAVENEQTFRLSAWAKASTATSGQLFIFCLDGDYKWQQFGGSSTSFTVQTYWQEFEHTRTCPDGTRYVSVRLDNNTPQRTIYWDDLHLEVVE